MPSDADQYATIKSQALAIIAEITATPKPSYRIDGQALSWNEYLTRLRATVDWCEKHIAGETPFEIQSQAYT